MMIINNIESNHYNCIKDLLRDANELHIVSPFLMESFDYFFDEIKNMKINYITLTTTLKDNNLDLLKKANSLHSFCSNCVTHEIDYKIYIDNKLHGKIYISSNNGQPLEGIITSANFTEAGLGVNHEWGVNIDNPMELKKIMNDISNLRSEALSDEQIKAIIKKIDSYSNNIGEPQQTKIDLSVKEYINQPGKTNESSKHFFLKPVGWSENPFSINRTLSSDIETLHFARRPRAINIGDILICYAVGTTKLLGYFEVLEEPINSMNEAERWPWSVKAKNLCSHYSERWILYQNTISSILDLYKSEVPITFVGGKTLGALNRGADKIQLTEEFARHTINIINNSL